MCGPPPCLTPPPPPTPSQHLTPLNPCQQNIEERYTCDEYLELSEAKLRLGQARKEEARATTVARQAAAVARSASKQREREAKQQEIAIRGAEAASTELEALGRAAKESRAMVPAGATVRMQTLRAQLHARLQGVVEGPIEMALRTCVLPWFATMAAAVAAPLLLAWRATCSATYLLFGMAADGIAADTESVVGGGGMHPLPHLPQGICALLRAEGLRAPSFLRFRRGIAQGGAVARRLHRRVQLHRKTACALQQLQSGEAGAVKFPLQVRLSAARWATHALPLETAALKLVEVSGGGVGIQEPTIFCNLHAGLCEGDWPSREGGGGGGGGW